MTTGTGLSLVKRIHPLTKEQISVYVDKNGNEYWKTESGLWALKHQEYPVQTKYSTQSGFTNKIPATTTKSVP